VSDASSALSSVAALIAVPVLLIALGLHVWYAVGLSRVFVEREVEPWRAWVPVLNESEVLRLGRVEPLTAVLFLVPLVNLYAVVMRVIAMHRIGVASRRGGALTVLGAVLPPAWAMVLGSRADAPETDDAPGPRTFGAGAVPVAPPTTAVPQVEAAPAVALVEHDAPVQPPVDERPAPAASVPLTRREARQAQATAASTPGWYLALPSGETVQLVATTVLLGRRPSSDDAAQCIPVDDDTRTVSKIHARLDWSDAGWTITDLGSTNGVAVTDDTGVEHPLTSGASTALTGAFRLGDAVLALQPVV
jgi:hypothetical protein